MMNSEHIDQLMQGRRTAYGSYGLHRTLVQFAPYQNMWGNFFHVSRTVSKSILLFFSQIFQVLEVDIKCAILGTQEKTF